MRDRSQNLLIGKASYGSRKVEIYSDLFLCVFFSEHFVSVAVFLQELGQVVEEHCQIGGGEVDSVADYFSEDLAVRPDGQYASLAPC